MKTTSNPQTLAARRGIERKLEQARMKRAKTAKHLEKQDEEIKDLEAALKEIPEGAPTRPSQPLPGGPTESKVGQGEQVD